MLDNIMLMTDSYKVSHWRQYPPGSEYVFSFFESRGGQYDQVVFFGLQYIVKRYLTGRVVTARKIRQAKQFWAAHFGDDSLFNESGWQHILDTHDGYLPIEIKSIPEGTIVPYRNALMTMVNTDPAVPWLTNWLETILSQVWYPCTVASQSRFMKNTILHYLQKNGTPEDYAFKLHDFGYRGVSSVETAAIGGAAHLVNFMGTDTAAGLELAMEYYGADMPGFSVPATEHSTMTSWGRENEVDAYRNTLEQYPTGIVSIVSDSYDIYRACEQFFGRDLREQILARDGILVVRPDSGDPVTVILRILDILADAFGVSKNDKGYQVLNPKIRIIQGDGIDAQSLGDILEAMDNGGWSADNITFGSGGGLLQKLNRDTNKFAIKCSAICIDGIWSDVIKDPITDPGKKSKAGRLSLQLNQSGEYVTANCGYDLPENLLKTVHQNGHMVQEYTFDQVRERASS